MKTQKKIIRQYIVLLLLLIQQVTSLMHIAYMPRFAGTDYKHQAAYFDFLHKNHNTGLPRVQFQRSFHAADESSRKKLTEPSRILTLFYVAFQSSPVTKTARIYLSAFYKFSSLSYLSLRNLRI